MNIKYGNVNGKPGVPTICLSFIQCNVAECEKLKSEDSAWTDGECAKPCQEKMAFY